MIIKRFLLFSIGWLLFLSCEEQKECCAPLPEIFGRFVHEIPNCDNSGNPEINCTEFMEFLNETEVDLLYGGGDIVYRFNYDRKDNIIHLEGAETSSFMVSFKIRDIKTLIRQDNGDVWRKE